MQALNTRGVQNYQINNNQALNQNNQQLMMNRMQGYDFNEGNFNNHQAIIENNPNEHSFDLWTKPDDFGFGINHEQDH